MQHAGGVTDIQVNQQQRDRRRRDARQARGQAQRLGPLPVQDLARLSPLQSFCGSSVDGRFYALDGTRQVLELRPEAGSLRPLYDASCALESAGPLSTP